jgi:hypothetical protein
MNELDQHEQTGPTWTNYTSEINFNEDTQYKTVTICLASQTEHMISTRCTSEY